MFPMIELEGANKGATASALDVGRLRTLVPGLGTAGLGSAAASVPPPRGKLLKLKLGFNPNSSSVGTTVVVFLWSLVASGAVLALAAAVFSYRFRRRRASSSPPGTSNAASLESAP